MVFEKHPTEEGAYCPRYEYIGTSNDHSFVHLERLSVMLGGVQVRTGAEAFVGRMNTADDGRRGQMLDANYFVSASLLDWIVTRTDVNTKGEFDINKVLKGSNLDIHMVDRGIEIHDVISFHNTAPYMRKVSNETIIVQGCITRRQFGECVKGVLNLSPPSKASQITGRDL
ncbi:UNVERIFIED_CONTAM: hypothetical protein HDU68_010047 [Siphonaria sp. JEL0065]|nr:hypothetical protein HDU68_010047 [Siphonaria sp. JEL0065]